jgi:hypothetical protein
MFDDMNESSQTSGEEDCPVCPGHGLPLGRFGRFCWYRCRACGIEFLFSPTDDGAISAAAQGGTNDKAGNP